MCEVKKLFNNYYIKNRNFKSSRYIQACYKRVLLYYKSYYSYYKNSVAYYENYENKIH